MFHSSVITHRRGESLINTFIAKIMIGVTFISLAGVADIERAT